MKVNSITASIISCLLFFIIGVIVEIAKKPSVKAILHLYFPDKIGTKEEKNIIEINSLTFSTIKYISWGISLILFIVFCYLLMKRIL